MAVNDRIEATPEGEQSQPETNANQPDHVTGPITIVAVTPPGGDEANGSVALRVKASIQQRLSPALRQQHVSFGLRWWAVVSGRRVTGLAAEGAFWVVFSLPWLLLAFVTGLGYAETFVGPEQVAIVEETVQNAVVTVLTPGAADQFATPVLKEIFVEGRADLGVLGLVLALWAGSRAVMTYVEAIAIINGEFRARGYVKQRLLALFFYLIGVGIALTLFPVSLVGPKQIGMLLGLPSHVVTIGCIVLVLIVVMTVLVGLFHFAPVERMKWRVAIPGATIALVASLAATAIVTIYVRRLFETNSIYGVLATPVAVMVYAYVLSFIVLAGAAFNAVRSRRLIFAAVDSHSGGGGSPAQSSGER